MYEADESAIAEMRKQVALLASQQIIIQACVGQTKKKVKFYRLWNSAASSYLPVSESFKKNYAYMTEDVLDYDERAWNAITTTEIETTSLDQLVLQDEKAPPPDFLSMNTQGSELEILSGAKHVLDNHVLAVQTEVSFPEIYERQAGIDDIIQFLKSSGFRIAALSLHGSRGHGFCLGDHITRTPIGLRGEGAVVQADALFVKEPLYILDKHQNSCLDLAKALFFGFIFKYFDYCYACGSAIKRLGSASIKSAAVNFRYARFVEDYLQAIEQYPLIFPPVWTSIFASDSGKQLEASTIYDNYFSSVGKEEFKDAVGLLINPDYFGLEIVALNYGLTDQANALRFNRLASIWNNMRYLGLVDDKEGGIVELHLDRIS